MTITTLPRSALRDVTPYIPGKSVASVERELGLKNVVKLASNENPLGPSPKAMAEYRRAERSSSLYPEGSSPELRAALARLHRVPEDNVVVGNGSDEILRLVCEAFLEPDDEVVLSQYAFIRFRQHAVMMGVRPIEVPMVDWTHDLDTMARACSPRTKLVFVSNPNNPTGTYNTRAELKAFLERVPSSALIVLDEAYWHFAREMPNYPDSLPGLCRRHPNLLVLRTFSKAYGLAGLRVGYAVADPEIIGWLDRIRIPFNVNLSAQRACVPALQDLAFLRKSAAAVAAAREIVPPALRGLGFSVVDSAANFVFAKSPVPGRELFKSLLRRGFIIRPLDEYGLGGYVRISFGTSAQNKGLVQAIAASLDVMKT